MVFPCRPQGTREAGWFASVGTTAGGNVQLAYEYGYGFDGGRRWRKDTVNGVWTRYPCGVACGAGELVEQTSDLSGSQWTTSALYLQGISLVRRNNEWHHFDPLGTAQVITNNSASVISNNLYDVFGVLRYEQGSAQAPWRWKTDRIGDEGLLLSMGWRNWCWVIFPGRLCVGPGCRGNPKCPPKNPSDPAYAGCLTICRSFAAYCKAIPEGSSLCENVLKLGCEAICADINNRDYFGGCYKPCLSLPSSRCGDCCEKLCAGEGGGPAICSRRCALAQEPDNN